MGLSVYSEIFVDFDQFVIDDAFNLVSARLYYTLPVLPMVPRGLKIAVRSNIKSLDVLPSGLENYIFGTVIIKIVELLS